MSLADRMAIASPNISAVTVEATEFPDLARQFEVQGVPRTVVNRGGAFVGALPEQQFVAAVLDLAGLDGQADTEIVVEPEGTEEVEAAAEPEVEAAADPVEAESAAQPEPEAEPAPDSAPDTDHGRH